MAVVDNKNRDPWAVLSDYVLQTASRDPDLLKYTPRAVGVETVAREDVLVVEDVPTARLCVLLAEALVAMSADTHEPGDQARIGERLGHAEAVVLVKTYNGVRPAARATGHSKDAIWRAYHEQEAA